MAAGTKADGRPGRPSPHRPPVGPSDATYRRGTYRTVAPEQTWARVQPLLRHYGITRVADVTGLDRLGIDVFQAVRPLARTVSVSQGKGLDSMSARVSAVMEAIELSHAEQFVPVATTNGTARDVAPLQAIGGFDLAPWSLVHPDLPVAWCTATGLITQQPQLVPVDLVRLDHAFPRQWAPPLFHATSNGLASGNSVTEATVPALAELCERDSLARVRGTAPVTWRWLDSGSVAEPDVQCLLERFEHDGTHVDVLIAGDDPYCVEVRIASSLHPVTYSGAGCHLDPIVALLRALTEAAQSRLTGIAGARDDLPPALFRPGLGHPTPARRVDPAELTSWAAPPASTATGDLEHDLGVLAQTVHDRTGTEPVRVVLPSAHDIAVVKVIAPGLRFDSRSDVSRPAAGTPR